MKKLVLATVIATSFGMSNAFAGTSNRLSGVYAGVDAGYANVKGDAQGTANALVNAFGGSVTVTEATSAAVGRVFAGYNIDKHFAVELGYAKTTNFTTTAAGVAGNRRAYTGTSDVSVGGLDYSLLIKPFDTSGWDGLFAKVGGHSLDSSADVSFSSNLGAASTHISASGSGFLVGVGYQEPLSSNVDYRVGYTYYNGVSGVSDNNAHVLTAGVLVKF